MHAGAEGRKDGTSTVSQLDCWISLRTKQSHDDFHSNRAQIISVMYLVLPFLSRLRAVRMEAKDLFILVRCQVCLFILRKSFGDE